MQGLFEVAGVTNQHSVQRLVRMNGPTENKAASIDAIFISP